MLLYMIFNFQSSTEICTAEHKRKFYDQFIPTIFDRGEISSKEHLFSIPMCCKKHGMDDDTPTSPNENIQDISSDVSYAKDNDTRTPPDENIQDISSDATYAKNINSQGKQNPKVKLQHKFINKTDPHDETTRDDNLDTENEYDVGPELQAILARLVSDYRAIFAIEDELHHTDGWSLHSCSIPHCHCNSYQDGPHLSRYIVCPEILWTMKYSFILNY